MERDEVSRLLAEVRAGNARAFDSLIGLVYDELRRIAGSLMQGQHNGAMLQPTAVVNEAYLRLVSGPNRWDNRAHFFGAAARAMRQVLMGEAARRAAQKREGGLIRVTLRDLNVAADALPEVDLLALEEAMTTLAQIDERFTRVIELRYFAGCTLEEIADLTGRSLAAVKRDWAYARAWLFERMTA